MPLYPDVQQPGVSLSLEIHSYLNWIKGNFMQYYLESYYN